MAREASLVALTELLEGISLANDYDIQVNKVVREMPDIKNLAKTEFPCLVIEDDGDEEIFWKTGGFADITFIINIIGWVQSRADLSTAMNLLDVAVKKAIGTNKTLGNTVVSMKVLPYIERSGSENAPFGFWVRPVVITYEGLEAEGL